MNERDGERKEKKEREMRKRERDAESEREKRDIKQGKREGAKLRKVN